MTQQNKIQKNADDFGLAIIIRIEGRNSRALVIRFVGIVAAMITIGVKVAVWLSAGAP
jgi:hypothetical protein